ncbi:MAG: tRNA pseudouridine(55) synthase TruB [Candidatus Eremiobacteraeota bacterium]|nr:tRNA pseudouridine(55) synthase TruB [Candidatus Eremiobacteraeota bacterium]MBV8499497.1 tRNA pseudouridine(55) synthase TruB [Candidatus Eremiobacteraeota bacterium]
MIGFVNLFKPAGPSSAHAVSRVRRIYALYAGDRKLAAGHLGTLDPQAAGVLPVAIGKATRLIPLLLDQRKGYVCTLVLGRSTTTQDAQGETVESAIPPADWPKRLEPLLSRFVGRIAQTPPMYSAARHRGRRLYELAREGKIVERRARPVTVYGLTMLGLESNAARLRVACSEGTYVRTLCHDLGAALGTPAHMGALVREASGPFVLYEARTLDEIARNPEGALIAPEHIIPFPTIVLDLRGSADFRAGRVVPLPEGATGRHVFVRDESRTLVGVGEALGTLLAPRKVFL